jgi:hypothetical protein
VGLTSNEVFRSKCEKLGSCLQEDSRTQNLNQCAPIISKFHKHFSAFGDIWIGGADKPGS